MAIFIALIVHSTLSVFFQSFFLHRYGAHRMFTMSKAWERTFHLLTYLTQGSSYLNPRAYAILHREHHAYTDGPKDPPLSREPPRLYVDDVGNQNQIRQLRLSTHQPRIKVRRWISRVASHRSSRELVGLKSSMGGALHLSLRRHSDRMVALSIPTCPFLNGTDPWRNCELVRTSLWLSKLR